MFRALDDMTANTAPRGSASSEAFCVRSGDAMSATDVPALDVARDRFGPLVGTNLHAFE
jgi:hypothetical protein